MKMPPPTIAEQWYPVVVPGPPEIKVIPKEKIVEYYNDLPTPATVANENAVVTAVAAIPPSPDGGTAVAVLTPDEHGVGIGSIEFRQEPRRFLQVKRSFFAEGYWLPVGDRLAEAALGVQPLRLGPIEVKIKAGVELLREDSTLKGFVAVGGEIHF